MDADDLVNWVKIAIAVLIAVAVVAMLIAIWPVKIVDAHLGHIFMFYLAARSVWLLSRKD